MRLIPGLISGVWFDKAFPGYTAVSSEGHSVLIQNGGENWREFRNLLLINITLRG